jgi:hypothetical protein
MYNKNILSNPGKSIDMQNILKINNKQDNICIINTNKDKEILPDINKKLNKSNKKNNQESDEIEKILKDYKYKCLKKCIYKNCYCETVLKYKKNEKYKNCGENNNKCHYISCTEGCKSKITNKGINYCEGQIQNSNDKLIMPPNFCNENRFLKYCDSSKISNNRLNTKCLQQIWLNEGCRKLGSLYPDKKNPIFSTIWYDKNLDESKSYIKDLYEKATLSNDPDSIMKCLDKLHIVQKNKKYEDKICRDDYKGNISPYDIKCLQKKWKDAGCNKHGSGYPTLRYNSSNFFFCNPQLKKCNILDLNSHRPKICWGNCSKKELDNDIKLLYIMSKAGNLSAKLKCLGHNEGFSIIPLIIKKNIILLVIISVLIITMYSIFVN